MFHLFELNLTMAESSHRVSDLRVLNESWNEFMILSKRLEEGRVLYIKWIDHDTRRASYQDPSHTQNLHNSYHYHITSILNTVIYIHQESSDMVQNNNFVVYALMPVGGAQQAALRPRVRPFTLRVLLSLGTFLIDAPMIEIWTIISWPWASPITPKTSPPPNTFVGGMLWKIRCEPGAIYQIMLTSQP